MEKKKKQEERRLHPRIAWNFVAKFKPKYAKNAVWETPIIDNISEGGCRFYSTNFHDVGDILEIEIQFPRLKSPMRFIGEVKRCEEDHHAEKVRYGIAVCFSKVEEENKKAFIKTISFFLKKQHKDEMNIFDYAMKMEKDGEEFYRDLAGKTQNEGFISILTWLADEEVRHYKIFESMKEGISPGTGEKPSLREVKNVFMKIKWEKDFSSLVSSQSELYKKARDLEEKSVNFYVEQSKATKNEENKDIFLKIAEEEKRHYDIIGNMIEIILKPDTWAEHAEFNHSDDYYL